MFVCVLHCCFSKIINHFVGEFGHGFYVFLSITKQQILTTVSISLFQNLYNKVLGSIKCNIILFIVQKYLLTVTECQSAIKCYILTIDYIIERIVKENLSKSFRFRHGCLNHYAVSRGCKPMFFKICVVTKFVMLSNSAKEITCV